jgi:hypothetical protein
MHPSQRVVVLKDQANKLSHSSSAQLACEAAGSIRTVAALTREDDCCALYSKSLEEPLRHSNRTAIWSNGLFSISQAMSFFVISLIFWYGSILVSHLEFSTFQFFVGLMVRSFLLHSSILQLMRPLFSRARHSEPYKLEMSSLTCQTSHPRKAQAPTFSDYSMLSLKSTQNPRMDRLSMLRKVKATFGLKTCISVTLPDSAFAFYVGSRWRLNQVHMSRSSGLVDQARVLCECSTTWKLVQWFAILTGSHSASS